jgi:hypothetical protein
VLRQCFAAFQLLSRWNNFQETSHAESWRELVISKQTIERLIAGYCTISTKCSGDG